MRRYSPYRSPPRRAYGGRERSHPPRRRGYGGSGGGGGGGGGGRREQNNGSLLVRNIPLNCRPEDLRGPFERFGPVRDVYIPRDYYSGEPRGFAFVQFVDAYDASEAQYHMHGQIFGGREITVVVAAETRKRPEEMRNRDRISGPSGRGERRSSYYGRSRSRSLSRSRSPRRSARRYSRSYSPEPRRREQYSVSPEPRESVHSRSPRDQLERAEKGRRTYTPDHKDAENHKQADDGYVRKGSYDEGKQYHRGSPRPASVSPPGSRSRSAELSPARDRSRSPNRSRSRS